MMVNSPSPLDLWRVQLELWHLSIEAQMVVTMRLLGMAGVWSVTPSETERMFGEKLPAFTNAAFAASRSAWKGERPDQILVAAIRPIRGKTYANSRRLSRRGLRY
ncbi:MAG: antifreeze protein [Pseudomonadota bacterium]|nr:antifreeze protein [Pseudomonadota bacterium]